MILLFATLIFVPWTTNGIDTDGIKNKTKRTLSPELFNYGETKPIYVYSDNLGSHSTARELPNSSSGSKALTLVNAPQLLKVYDQQVPKVLPQPQQNLYEYPVATNTAPNVQLRHFIQPYTHFNQDVTTQNTQIPDYNQISPSSGHNFVPSETVVLPVQQRQPPALINNGQPYTNIRLHPNYNAQTVPRKFVYTNGRLIYDPNHVPYLQQNINHPQVNPLLVAPNHNLQYYPQQRSERPPIINYVNRNHPHHQNLNTPAPANMSPTIYNRFSPTAKKQLQPILSSLTVPHKNDEKSERENEDKDAPVKEKDDNEESGEDTSNDQEEDFEQHEENPIFNKYSFDDYEENDHHNYRDNKEVQDDDDEDDNKRGHTKHVVLKKYPRKYSKGEKHSRDYYRYADSDSKYDHPEGKSNRKSNKRPKMVYKSVKYSREINSKPKGDSIEGRHSENVPVTHKHNRIFKEKWYISKTDENLEAK